MERTVVEAEHIPSFLAVVQHHFPMAVLGPCQDEVVVAVVYHQFPMVVLCSCFEVGVVVAEAAARFDQAVVEEVVGEVAETLAARPSFFSFSSPLRNWDCNHNKFRSQSSCLL